MKRLDEVESLKQLGLNANEARILAGLGMNSEKFLYLSMFDLREHLIGIESRRTRQEIMAFRRLIAVQETFREPDKTFWGLVRPDIQNRFIKARVPYWYALTGTRSEMLRIPGVGKRAWEYLQFMRARTNALREYALANSGAFNQIFIVPFIEGPGTEDNPSTVLKAHQQRLMWPVRGDYTVFMTPKYTAPYTFMLSVLKAINPAQFNHVAMYLPLQADEEQVDFVKEFLWLLIANSPVAFQYEVFGSGRHDARLPLPIPETLRFELVRSGSPYGSGVIQLPTYGEWDIRYTLQQACPIMHGGKTHIFSGVDLLHMRLIVEEAS